MNTTVHDRFHVCCPACCGLVASYSKRADALSHARTHGATCDAAKDVRPRVFDVMARRGAAQEWSQDGRVTEMRMVDE